MRTGPALPQHLVHVHRLDSGQQSLLHCATDHLKADPKARRAVVTLNKLLRVSLQAAGGTTGLGTEPAFLVV